MAGTSGVRGVSGGAVRAATGPEIARWDELVASDVDGGDVWRARDYAELKRRTRYHPRYVLVGDRPVTVLEKKVPLLGGLWYLPGGPGVTDVGDLIARVDALAGYARDHGAFAVKVEPRLPRTDADRDRLIAHGYREVSPIAPNATTVVVDITGEPDEVMGRFSTRARRWIRRAERDGVVVERVPATEDNCRIMYGLLSGTADARFGIRVEDYYRDCWPRYEASGQGQLFFARFDGEVVAGAFVKRLGEMAFYKDGGSVRKNADSSAKNGLGAHGVGHAVQWAAMTWARENGCTRYDLGSVPSAARIDDRTHPYHGLGEFKRSFNKEVTEYLGAFDLPLGHNRYRVWQSGLEREMRRFTMLARRDAYY
ncbi:lipid II:glycine glycyltransferase FemX [Rhodococcus sp. NPDC127528]|uniref:lipid II:glycine glycyltransferase FemX n=1 Tax=unclassified Rhodococcus (in: high G+C Gram-positive bacteria) TaxID=192944 RepID=UPI00363F3A59